MKKQIEVIERAGAKTVAKKASFVAMVKRVFLVFSIIWLAIVATGPLYVKNNYSGPIKKTMVVSMFFDLQRNIVEQYEQLLGGIKKSINLEKPISIAIDKVKMAEKPAEQVKNVAANAKNTSADVKKLSGIAGKFGVKTGSVDNVINNAEKTITKVDDTANLVNKKLDSVKKELVSVSQTEVDKMVDDAIKNQLDKNSGGLGSTLLTNYGIQHVYPWRPSSWPVGVKIYNDLEKSNVGVVQIITNTVDTYFGYVAWGLVAIAWLVGLFIWMQVFKKVKMITAPFVVCPRCGHAFADKRTAYSFLKILQPWKWL
ncbi:MAG: hypothetical protein JW974_03285 [Alphaproteobacteria bacterium]|jgi:hypothetical protein|nr:hypothetical protein [Alphaproteobacteria bacterium]MBN2674881.1 hypothetical protein [Alphaproteobacteria bacterium]